MFEGIKTENPAFLRGFSNTVCRSHVFTQVRSPALALCMACGTNVIMLFY